MTFSEQLVESYLSWLKAKITVKEIGDAMEITTPFLDRHNDRLQIFVKQQGNDLILTDGGYIFSDLTVSGIDMQSENRQRLLTSVLCGFGVRLEGEDLIAKATLRSFPQKKHALIQAMLTVNDMFLTSRSTVASLFVEEVQAWFQKHDIRYVPSVQLVGKSGFSHRFSFVIPASKERPERLVETLNIPDRNRIEPLLFAWNDTRDTRQSDSVLYALLNDTERTVSTAVLSALEEYDVKPILWTHREQYAEELAA